MKLPFLLALFCISSASAQSDFPGNPNVKPEKFKTRPIGGGVNPGASLDEAKPQNVRYITHIILHDSRLWTSTEGKPLEAKLIAFEDLVVEAPKGSAKPEMPAPPANPTVVRGGKIRLIVNKKPVELALDRLTEADREFVEQIRASLAKKAAAVK